MYTRWISSPITTQDIPLTVLRTPVFTIHQPRINIVSLFDQLIVLAQGKLVYSGDADKVTDYLAEINHPCPLGFNVADFLSTLLASLLNAQRTDSSSFSS